MAYQQSRQDSSTVTARYEGDGTYAPSSGTTTASLSSAIIHQTSTSVSCGNDPVPPGSATLCSVLIQDETAGSYAPMGAVTITVAGPDGTSARGCLPQYGGCSIAITPGAAGTYALTASFSGAATPYYFDANCGPVSLPGDITVFNAPCAQPGVTWLPSSGTTTLTARVPTDVLTGTRTSVSCDPSTVVQVVQWPATCAVTVTAPAGGATPTGSVTFSDGGCTTVCAPSAFRACFGQTCQGQGGTCTLVAGQCQVTVAPGCYPGSNPPTYPVCSWAGQEAIKADYSGDSGHDPSTGSSEITSVTLADIYCLPVICGL